MKNLKIILNKLKNKSNIDYEYYFLFNNQLLDLFYFTTNFIKNHIIYIINSDFNIFSDYLKTIKEEFVTDIFFERLRLSEIDKKNLFNMKFKWLFWLKLNFIEFNKSDYKELIKFLSKNSLDINRIFLENNNLWESFFSLFQELNWFNNLSFINFDNNNIKDKGIINIISFLNKNNINLEYLSLINTWLTDVGVNNLFDFFMDSNYLRILDISSNKITNTKKIIYFIKNNNFINELFLRNIIFSNNELNELLDIFNKNNTTIYNLRFSLSKDQLTYIKKFINLWNKKKINFDVDIIWNSKKEIFSTIYIKQIDNNYEKLKSLDNNYFSIVRNDNIEKDFSIILEKKQKYLNNWINLFLFDFNDYKKIDLLIKKYNFNYIYVENYFIIDKNLIQFLDSIKNQENKKYKINLISIELSEFQLKYLIDYLPENIFYIEVNLNKIIKNRELYISKMLKNKAFIFENMEFYQKIFK